MSEILDLVTAGLLRQGVTGPGVRRKFRAPQLGLWSINQVETTELTGGRRADYERELRISALGLLMEALAATPLWRRVCCREMYREIRERSADQRVAMELAIAESMRRPS